MVNVHLVDGTYDLYRMYYGSPKRLNANKKEIGASRSFLLYLYGLISSPEISHIGVAFSTVIESFRNDYLDSYKTSARVPPDLFEQFLLAEQITDALGLTTWGMIDYEADDAIATAAVKLQDNESVDQIIIFSPDKDFGQVITGNRVIMEDRVRKKIYDEAGVIAKWGVRPESIPDLLALTGDKADGIPGVPKWGNKSAAEILKIFHHIENIPVDPNLWGISLRGSTNLAVSLQNHRKEAMLYKMIATLKTDLQIDCNLKTLEWKEADRDKMEIVCETLEMPEFMDKLFM